MSPEDRIDTVRCQKLTESVPGSIDGTDSDEKLSRGDRDPESETTPIAHECAIPMTSGMAAVVKRS